MERNSIILIVDDELFGRKTLEALLTSPDYTLAFATSGPQALELALQLTPDLILLDVMMPDMNGFEVCRRLRDNPRLAEVPVIMVTSLGDRTSRLQGIEAGADDIVSKPFDAVELRTRVRTITRLNRYRRLLLERAKFERVTELAPDGIVIVDAHGTICLSNPAFLRMLRVQDARDIQGASVLRFVATNDVPGCFPCLSTSDAEVSSVTRFETVFERMDGSRFPVEINTGPIVWDGMPAAQIIVRDNTERKRAEEALRESEKHLRRSRDALRAIFDGLDHGLSLLDSDQTVLAINQTFCQLLNHGVAPDTLVGQTWDAVCHAVTPPFPFHAAMKSLHDGRAHRYREQYTSTDGQTRFLDIHSVPLISPEQGVDQVMVSVVDVTERLHLETLALQNEHFAARGRLAATVAHEVNTPLQSIQNCLYLAEKTTSTQRNAYLELAREELERISSIVRQLLDIPHARDDSQPGRININNLVERVLLLTGGTLASYGIDVERDLVANPPRIAGYADHLMQVLLNLILNAIDAMPDGGKLRVHTSIARTPPENRYTSPPSDTRETGPLLSPSFVIAITDSGCGMAPDVQSHVFDPFFTTRSNGSGVGLAISHRIVAQHGGKIKVQSILGSGSTFTIILPLRSAYADSIDL